MLSNTISEMLNQQVLVGYLSQHILKDPQESTKTDITSITLTTIINYKTGQGFSGGSGGTGSIPGPGRSLHAPEQLIPRAATTEPTLWSFGAAATEVCALQSLCSTRREATAMRSPGTTTREQPPVAVTREKPEQEGASSTAKHNLINKM